VPDVIIYCKGKPLLLEISVTHPLDNFKLNKIRKLGISTIEINLRNSNGIASDEEFMRQIVYGLNLKRWAFNTRKEDFLSEIKARAKTLKIYYRKLYECPILSPNGEKSVADLIDNCFNCDYFIHASGISGNQPKFIRCVGHVKSEIEDMIKKLSEKNKLSWKVPVVIKQRMHE
jgi:hypothetical protein